MSSGVDLDRFARLCRTVRGLKNARIGAIGARTGPFQTMRFSEKLLQDSGLTVVTVDLSEMIAAAGAITDSDADLAAKLSAIKDYGTIPAHISEDQILRQAKWSLAVNRWIAENECDASAIQCWRSASGQFRLRHLPDDVDDGRGADALGLRGRCHGRDLDVCADACSGRAIGDP